LDLKRILVFRTGHLGDTLVAVPAFHALRRTFPSAEIVYLSNADQRNPQYVSARDVLPADGLFDDWISYPNAGDLKSLARLAMKIRRTKFDAVIYLMTRYRTARQIDRDKLFFRFAGIRTVIGAAFIKENNLPLEIPRPVPRVEKEGDFLMRMLRESGVVDPQLPFDSSLALTEDERNASRRWMQSKETADIDVPRIAVGPGSKWESKIWAEERYRSVVGRLIENYDVMPVIFGGPEDKEKGNRLIDQWGRGANAAGELDVRGAAAAIEECDLYLGNDTGTMHLAAAVGTPCIAIFSAIDWVGRFEPFGDHNVVFRRSVECEGCHSPVCLNVNHRNKCLDLIEADDVFDACVDVLERQDRRRVEL